MPFKKGHKKIGGRKKGGISKDRQMVMDLADQLGCNPFEIMIHVAMGNFKALGYKCEGQDVHTATGVVSHFEYWLPAEMRLKAAGELAQKIVPNLKSVEVSNKDQDKPFTVTFNLGETHARHGQPPGTDPASK